MSSLFASTRNTRPLLPDQFRYVRSDAPKRLTAEEVQFLLDHEITTLVDLRTLEETQAAPCCLREDARFSYHHMPVSGGDTIPDSPDAVSASYLRMVDARMEAILALIEASDRNVLYFCSAGKDRTGVVSALLLRRLGFPEDYIIQDYLRSAENLHDVLQSFAAALGIDPAIITPQPRYMQEFLQGLS